MMKAISKRAEDLFSILIKVPGFESLKEVEDSRECEEGVRE